MVSLEKKKCELSQKDENLKVKKIKNPGKIFFLYIKFGFRDKKFIEQTNLSLKKKNKSLRKIRLRNALCIN